MPAAAFICPVLCFHLTGEDITKNAGSIRVFPALNGSGNTATAVLLSAAGRTPADKKRTPPPLWEAGGQPAHSYITIIIYKIKKSIDIASYLWYHRHTSAGGFFVVRSVHRRFPLKREIFFIYFFGGITAGVRQTATPQGRYREERKGQVI